MIRPRRGPGPGVVLELKVARPGRKTLAQALAEGAAQIEEGSYRAELIAAGVSPLHALVVAFDGKKVQVRNLADRPARKPARKKATRPRKKATTKRRS